MKKTINGIIVVEGTNDASYLASFIDAEIVELNGLELKNIAYLQKVQENKNIFLLTDPDEEGINIRNKVKKYIKNPIDIQIDLKKCSKGVKNGVAECEKEEIERAFNEYFIEKTNENEEKIVAYKSDFRKHICNLLNMEECNNKTFNKRMNSLGISKEKLNNMYKEYNNGN